MLFCVFGLQVTFATKIAGEPVGTVIWTPRDTCPEWLDLDDLDAQVSL